MTLLNAASDIIDSSLSLLDPKFSKNPSKVYAALLAIGLQESLLVHRYQVLNQKDKKGPARGLWQFERGGGVIGVMRHSASAAACRSICQQRGVTFDSYEIWKALEYDDVLAAALARLLLYTDPFPLPELNNTDGLWNCYLRVWRPGAYFNGTVKAQMSLRDKFYANHKEAVKYVMAR